MTFAVGMFVLGVAVGQFALLVVGLVFNHARERAARESRYSVEIPDGVEVFRAWPPRSRNHTRETVQ